MSQYRVVYQQHAIQRMAERGISEEEVSHALLNGETIEDYPNDTPYPSRLVLGWQENRPIHVVVATDPVDLKTIVITVYEPNLQKWEPDFKRRKS